MFSSKRLSSLKFFQMYEIVFRTYYKMSCKQVQTSPRTRQFFTQYSFDLAVKMFYLHCVVCVVSFCFAQSNNY